MKKSKKISAVIPISERQDDLEALYSEYKLKICEITDDFEFIYIVDGPHPDVSAVLTKLKNRGEPITIIEFAKWFGEANALSAGFDAAKGQIILTLPAYNQIDLTVVPKLVQSLAEAEMSVAVRLRSNESTIKRFQGYLFNRLASSMSNHKFRDLGCGVRAMKRIVIEELNIYGDQHRFLPILASQRGFRVIEIVAN